jgi:iron complex outermembrane recepter protein
MKSALKRRCIANSIAMGCAFTLASASAVAAVAADLPEAQEPIDEIVVTAQKIAQPLEKVPISIKVITAETLETIGAESAEDYLRMIPSVSMTNLARGGNEIQIRGLGSNVGNVGTVAIYNDGVISPSRIQQGGTFSEQDPALFDVERVEVLRGPQGTLYGEGSFGGVINIISKRPTLDSFQTSVAATWFNRNEGSSNNQDFSGMVNLPIISGELALRAVAYSYQHDGWINQVGPVLGALFAGQQMSIENEHANSERTIGGRAIALFAPNENIDVTATFKTEKIFTGAIPVISPNIVAEANAAVGDTFNTQVSQADYFADAVQTRTNQGILEINVNTDIGRLTSIGGGGRVSGGTTTGVTNANSAYNEELRLASDTKGAFTWIVGGYYRNASAAETFMGAPLAGNTVKEYAVFGQGYWHFAPQWTATVGLRYEHQTSDVQDKVNLLSSNATFSSTPPKFALEYQWNDHTMYYTSIAKGFRAGGANIDESLGTDPRYRAPFNPDSIWSYEIGSKVSFLDRTLTVNSAIYYISWKDIQIDQPINSLVNPPVEFIVVNGQNAHSYGVETDIYYTPTPLWSISLGGSLLNAEYDSGSINQFPTGSVELNGQQLPSTPKYTANASVERLIPMPHLLQGYVRADYTLRGSSYGDVPNYPPPGLFGPGNLASGSSQITNLRAGIRRNGWDAQVFCTNLFNSHASTYTDYDGGFTDLQVLLPPRTIGVTIHMNYN